MPTTVSAMVATRPNAVSLASRLPPPPNDDCPVSLFPVTLNYSARVAEKPCSPSPTFPHLAIHLTCSVKGPLPIESETRLNLGLMAPIETSPLRPPSWFLAPVLSVSGCCFQLPFPT